VQHHGLGRHLLAALALVLILLAAPAVASATVGPTLLAPRNHAAIAHGTRPTFSVRDRSVNARKYEVWLTISSKKRVKHGELQIDRGPSGAFSHMRRRAHGRYTYRPPLYTFPTYFLQRPGTYWWQAHHIDCSVPTVRNCHIVSPIRSFRVV